jgi:hypothetical protein
MQAAASPIERLLAVSKQMKELQRELSLPHRYLDADAINVRVTERLAQLQRTSGAPRQP